MGAPYTTPDGTKIEAGRALLYLGSPAGLSPTPAWTGAGDDAPRARFGHSVTSIGDVNGDGLDDVIVGAPGSFIVTGFAYGYRGVAGPSGGLEPTFFWRVSGAPSFGAGFGFAVASAGDVDGNGLADAIVGAPGFAVSMSQADAGRAYIYLAQSGTLDPAPIWQASGFSSGDSFFGWAVSGAGDVNGDGVDDAIVGAPGNPSGVGGSGRVYYYEGQAGSGPTPAFTSSFGGYPQTGDRFGVSLASIGDYDGNGSDDIIVGADMQNVPAAVGHVGKAFVFRGTAAGVTPSPIWTSSGDLHRSAFFGRSVAGLGDIDGDLILDFAIGAPGFDVLPSDHDMGKAYVMCISP